MENEVATFDQSVELCKLGFNETTFCAYESETRQFYLCHLDEEGFFMPEKDIKAPLKQQVFKYFRDKFGVISIVEPYFEPSSKYSGYGFGIMKDSIVEYSDEEWDTFEEAENACIDKVISILKEQNPRKSQTIL